MEIINTEIPNLIIIKPEVYSDPRGYFLESFSEKRYKEAGINAQFIQDNISKSSYGVIRGLHYQLAPYSQSKLVSVIEGTILDVAVDLRKNSPTFGQHFAIELSDENKLQFFIPQGFAHGFSVLSESAVVVYKCDNYFSQEAERGIAYNDANLKIDWKIPAEKAIISSKDSILPSFKEAEHNFVYSI
ncbi:dTDP-4-dehydrorhamnose 3,5-epimerase [Carboxylicivirga sediminis]|uniref:dTDP-4-dehydrorhamnose 3,5-epimerase n=1 Tax=Carboxylicivirga sediminis TaxID=2006564 RepID=A0A941F2S5_9BACT|nr:dTDP-4-dehydrorhamnose 3,5-epimerase [Carboxylicivirga sediminis]MBR8535292.1 dTDP-4-dehydrorhamnose 3,5-epimerase [Carboxylicivirga sediminis]